MNERYISCFEQVNEMKSLIKSIRFIKVRFRGNEMDGCYLRKIDIIYGCCLIKKKRRRLYRLRELLTFLRK